MGVNKVILHGETLIDLTGDSVAPELMALGTSAHAADGEAITGTLPIITPAAVTLDGTVKSYTVPAGIHDGTGTVGVQTQTKSVTPSTAAQTVTPSDGYLLSSVSVKAAKLYATGTVTESLATATYTINTGVTLKAADIFILMPDASITDERPISSGSWIACAMRSSASNFRIGILTSSGLGWYMYDTMSIAYSGKNVTVEGGSFYFRGGVVYRWVLLR